MDKMSSAVNGEQLSLLLYATEEVFEPNPVASLHNLLHSLDNQSAIVVFTEQIVTVLLMKASGTFEGRL